MHGPIARCRICEGRASRGLGLPWLVLLAMFLSAMFLSGHDAIAVELRWHLVPGQVYRVNVERIVRQNSPAAQWTDETRYLLVWSVQSVDTTGTAEISQTLAEVRETLRWGESEPVEYDSTSKQEIHGDALNFARHWQPQLNAERRFRLSPLGQWLAAGPGEATGVSGANPPSTGESSSPTGGAGSSTPATGARPTTTPAPAASGPATPPGPLAGSASSSAATPGTPAATGPTATTTAPPVSSPLPSAASGTPNGTPNGTPASAAASATTPASLPGGVRPIYCVLPASALQTGTQWTETHTMPQGDRPDAWQLTTAFTYAGTQQVEDRSLHRIDVDCRWRSAPPNAAAGVATTPAASLVLERQEGAGQILFDQEAGYMTSSQLNQELITRSRRQDGTTFQSEIVTTVRLRIEAIARPASPPAPGVDEVEPPPTVSQPVSPAVLDSPGAPR